MTAGVADHVTFHNANAMSLLPTIYESLRMGQGLHEVLLTDLNLTL